MDRKINPEISILMLTYNHEAYIEKAIQGVLNQKIDVRIELLIGEDFSTDSTRSIVEKYEKTYPELVCPVYMRKNIGCSNNLIVLLSRAKGKYIAICDGDDYWCDPLKLSKQYQLMETHPSYVICFHQYYVYVQETKATYEDKIEFLKNGRRGIDIDLDFYIMNGWNTIPLSAFFRRNAVDIGHLKKYKALKDISLFYNILTKGLGYIMSDRMGVYRKHKSGIWSGASLKTRMIDDLASVRSIYEVDMDTKSETFFYQIFLNKFAEACRKHNWQLALAILKEIRKYTGHIGVIKYIFRTLHRATKHYLKTVPLISAVDSAKS